MNDRDTTSVPCEECGTSVEGIPKEYAEMEGITARCEDHIEWPERFE